MQKLDRLVWAAGICGTAYGVRIGIRANRPEALREIEGFLPLGWKSTTEPRVDQIYSIVMGRPIDRPNARSFHIIYGGVNQVARTPDFQVACELFASDLQLLVAEHARRRVFVHAGVVGWKDRAILIPGRSTSGKTTLVAELVRAGATYFSDEFAVLDPQGSVHPYAVPLAIRSRDASARMKMSAAELGGATSRKPLPVSLVVVSQYKPGSNWRPRACTTGQGILALLANTIPARRNPAAVLKTLHRTVQGARIFKGTRGEAKNLLEWIFEGPDVWPEVAEQAESNYVQPATSK